MGFPALQPTSAHPAQTRIRLESVPISVEKSIRAGTYRKYYEFLNKRLGRSCKLARFKVRDYPGIRKIAKR